MPKQDRAPSVATPDSAVDSFVHTKASDLPPWQVCCTQSDAATRTYAMAMRLTEEGAHARLDKPWRSPDFEVGGVRMHICRTPDSNMLRFWLFVTHIDPSVAPEHVRLRDGKLIWQNNVVLRLGDPQTGTETLETSRAANTGRISLAQRKNSRTPQEALPLYESQMTDLDLAAPASPLRPDGNLDIQLSFSVYLPHSNFSQSDAVARSANA